MSSDIQQQNWWQMSPDNYPPAFTTDRRTMEAARLQTLLTYAAGRQQDGVWDRVRRAATLMENYSVAKTPEAQRVWEMIALTYESIGVVERDKRDHQWLLSALCWQLAEMPSIAEYLANQLIKSESFSKRDLMEQMALAFSARNFRILRGLAEFTIDEGNRYKSSLAQNSDSADATEAIMLLSVGTAFKNLTRFLTFYGDDFPDISGLNDFNELAMIIGDARRFRLGRLLADCTFRFLSASSRILVQDLPDVSEQAKESISRHLQRYAELWPSQREAISKGLLSKQRKHFVVSVPTSSGKTLCGELAIIQELTENGEAVCFYVVPTRALVEEKSRDCCGREHVGRIWMISWFFLTFGARMD